MAYEPIGFGLGNVQVDRPTSPLQDAILGLLNGFQAFLQARQLSRQAQAEMEFRRSKLRADMEEARQKNELERYKVDTERDWRMADVQGQNERSRLFNTTRQGIADAERQAAAERQRAGFEFQAKYLFPHQMELRQAVPGGATANQESIDARQRERNAYGMVQRLIEQGSIDPGDQNAIQEQLYFYSLSPEEQQAYLEEKSNAEEERRQQELESDIPGMRQEAIGAIGRMPEARQRIEALEQSSPDHSVRFQDIYGLGAEQVIGPKGEIPTAMLHEADAAGDVLRRDKKGNYVPDLTLYKRAIDFLNRRGRGVAPKARPANPQDVQKYPTPF